MLAMNFFFKMRNGLYGMSRELPSQLGNHSVNTIRIWLNQVLRRLHFKRRKNVNQSFPLTKGNSLKLRMEREGVCLVMWVARKLEAPLVRQQVRVRDMRMEEKKISPD